MAFPKDLIHLFFNPMAQYCYSIRINNTTISTNIIPINIPGDFYVTKHSNLSDIHVVFHMVTDGNNEMQIALPLSGVVCN